MQVRFGNTGSVDETISANGTFTYVLISDGTSLYFRAIGGFDGSITNISVKEITDDTNIPRINYEGFSYQDSLGSEEIVGGDFSFSSGWSGQKTIANGQLTKNSTGLVYQSTLDVSVKNYKVVVDVDTAGASLTIYLGGAQQSLNVGINTIDMQSGGSNSFVGFNNGNGSVINSISVKEVTGQEVVPDSGCGSWLLEPQSTNLITYSEDFSQWNQVQNISLTSNATISPSGVVNATKLLSSDFNSKVSFTGLSFVAGTSYTISVFCKNIDATSLKFFIYMGGAGGDITYDFTNQVNTSGWTRVSYTFVATGTNSANQVQFARNLPSGESAFFWGFQIEQQSYATSYIPTNGAANTRLQDIATNSGNSSLINSTSGVLYAEIAALANDLTNRYIIISDGSLSNRVSLRFSGSNEIRTFVQVGGSFVSSMSKIIDNILIYNKIALKWSENNFSLWINGVEVATDISGITFPIDTLNRLSFEDGNGGSNFFGKTKALAVYKEALTDANLRCLTYPPAVATTFDLDFDTIAEQFTFTRGSEATFVNAQGLIQSTNQLGPELVTNGDFATDSDWNKGNGWSISGGKANSDGTNNYDQLRQTNILTIGKSYKLSFDLTYVSGLVKFTTPSVDSEYNSSGTYTLNFIADSANVVFTAWGAFTGSIDNVSVKEVISATNTPRIDYSTGAKAFLLEPQSTNYSLNSEQPSTWHSSGGAIVTANAATSPEGIQNSSLVVANGSSGAKYVRNLFTFPTGSGLQTVTVSYFIKYYNNQWVRLRSMYFIGSPANGKSTYFDIQNGVIGTSDATHTAKIEDYGSGWYRCSITFDIDKSADNNGYGHIEVMDGDNSNIYAAIGQGFYAFGSQGEEFSYPTSYIPSGAAYTTRNQELCVDATPVINSEEGTLYAER